MRALIRQWQAHRSQFRIFRILLDTKVEAALSDSPSRALFEEGRLADRHEREARDAMDEGRATDERACSRTAKPCGTSAADFEVPTADAANSYRNFKIESGTGI